MRRCGGPPEEVAPVAVGRTFRPMTDAQVRALLAKTAKTKTASRGEFELFKTTSIFDATATNPAWLGEEPERPQR